MQAPLGHVKWFSHFDWSTPPENISQLTNNVFWAMLGLSVLTLILMVLLDKWIERQPFAERAGRYSKVRAR